MEHQSELLGSMGQIEGSEAGRAKASAFNAITARDADDIC